VVRVSLTQHDSDDPQYGNIYETVAEGSACFTIPE